MTPGQRRKIAIDKAIKREQRRLSLTKIALYRQAKTEYYDKIMDFHAPCSWTKYDPYGSPKSWLLRQVNKLVNILP